MKATIAHLGEQQAKRFGERVYCYHHDGTRWAPTTWKRAAAVTREISLGLCGLGCEHGDKVAILCETRPDWSDVDMAVLAFGGITVGIYPTSTAEQTRYIVEHSEAKVIFVENAAQLAKVESFRGELPSLKAVVVIDEHGVDFARGDGGPIALSDLRRQGAKLDAEQPALADERRDKVEPDDVATLVYTSGTTGPPKGVVLTHANLYRIAEVCVDAMGLTDNDVGVVFLPLAHSLQRVAAYNGLLAGTMGYFAPSLDRLAETWKVAQPTVLSSVPRIFEKIHAKIMTGLSEASPVKQRLFAAAMAVGRKRSQLIQRGQRVPFYVEKPYELFDRLVFSKVREATFGTRVRYLVSGGAPIAKELLEFFHAVGLLILEGYGLTETSAPATINRPGDFRFGSVGKPLPGVGIKIADDGEILINGAGLFREYYKAPEATSEAIDEQGWFRSGDIGRLDADGYLYITDRKKDLIITAGGKNIAPQNIENLIKSDKHISQIMVHGDKRKYLVALVTLDAEEMRGWSRREYGDERALERLVDDPAVVALIDEVIGRVNATLPRYETIKKFRLLADDFTVENEMLTPTLKVKRRVIEKRYRELLDGMYDG